MNLFRSEEHIRNWAGYKADSDEGITPLPDMLKLFSGPYFKRRLDRDYVSHMREYAVEMIAVMKEIGKIGPFWKRPKS